MHGMPTIVRRDPGERDRRPPQLFSARRLSASPHKVATPSPTHPASLDHTQPRCTPYAARPTLHTQPKDPSSYCRPSRARSRLHQIYVHVLERAVRNVAGDRDRAERRHHSEAQHQRIGLRAIDGDLCAELPRGHVSGDGRQAADKRAYGERSPRHRREPKYVVGPGKRQHRREAQECDQSERRAKAGAAKRIVDRTKLRRVLRHL
mmetsp:Transcript_58516/g.153701  ORF Transcript_58516/g.153701 Transcript_58516/m.153701 type:complete len:206 (+) Transcript_58516:168-785(+)